MNEVTFYTLPLLKCIIRLVSLRSSLPCNNIGVRIEQTTFFVVSELFTEVEKYCLLRLIEVLFRAF